jgi:hypothetical protein
VESNKEGMIAIGCHLAGGLFLLAVTWKQEWSPPRKDACFWLSRGRRIIPIGCFLEVGVESHQEGMIAIGCHRAGGLFLLAVTVEAVTVEAGVRVSQGRDACYWLSP